MVRRAGPIVLAALAIGAAATLRGLVRSHVAGRPVPGGLLMRDAGAYDTISRVLLGPSTG